MALKADRPISTHSPPFRRLARPPLGDESGPAAKDPIADIPSFRQTCAVTLSRWLLTLVLAVLAAALMARPNFGSFLAHLAGILLLGFTLREIDKAKRLRGEKRRDSD